jgi:hypothetical protein
MVKGIFSQQSYLIRNQPSSKPASHNERFATPRT